MQQRETNRNEDKQREATNEEQEKYIGTYVSLHVARFPFLLGKFFGGSWRPLWVALKPSCGLLARLVAFGGALGLSWRALGCFWAALDPLLGRSLAALGRPSAALGHS